MANYTELARTNYFKVKDLDAFKNFVAALSCTEWDIKEGHIALFFYEGMPNEREVKPDEYVDFNIEDLAPYLAQGEVLILQCIGHEKLRTLNGYALALRPDGKTIVVDTYDIYKKVKDAWEVEPKRACL